MALSCDRRQPILHSDRQKRTGPCRWEQAHAAPSAVCARGLPVNKPPGAARLVQCRLIGTCQRLSKLPHKHDRRWLKAARFARKRNASLRSRSLWPIIASRCADAFEFIAWRAPGGRPRSRLRLARAAHSDARSHWQVVEEQAPGAHCGGRMAMSRCYASSASVAFARHGHRPC